MNIKNIPLLAWIVLLGACGITKQSSVSQHFNYFHQGVDTARILSIKPLLIRPKDLIDIQVLSNSMNQDQAAIFNRGANVTSISSENETKSTSKNNSKNYYEVDELGFVQIAILGNVKAAGLSCSELANSIQKTILQKEFIKDPIVKVNFMQMKINVLGEVRSPGTKTFSTDRVTFFDGIGAAGDLTDQAQRDDIIILREDNGFQKALHVNLLDFSLVEKEGFQLHPNDVIYVPANDAKLQQLAEDPRTTKRLQTGVTIASVSVVLINLIMIFIK